MNNQANLALKISEDHSQEPVRYRLGPTQQDFPTPEIDHWVVQLWGVAPEQINGPERLNGTLSALVEELSLTKVSDHTHFFGPGVSTVIILSESHLSAHTWPEMGYLHADLVTCVKKLSRHRLEAAFRGAFEPRHLQLAQLEY